MAGAMERPKGPGVTYGALALALVVLLALFALTARQPPPPSIAEFAPQAVEQITDSPDDQSSTRGAAAGGLAVPTPAAPGDAAGGLVIDLPRVRRCVGDPPRQTEDPQSPPCVPYWTGDNGGATSRGVTRDSITVAMHTGETEIANLLVQFFNRRYEFYGRKLVPRVRPVAASNCEVQRGVAVTVAEEWRAFATTHTGGNAIDCFYHEVLRRGVVLSQATSRVTFTRGQLAASSPYAWEYTTAMDDQMASLGRWVCRRLAGRNARFSSDPLISTKQRKFGLLFQPQTTPPPFRLDFDPIRREMSRCGQSLDVFVYENVTNSGDPASDSARAMLQMKTAGVSTIFCYCVAFNQQYIPAHASSQQYYPEWALLHNDRTASVKAFWPQTEQRRALMGIHFMPMQVRYEDEPTTWALREAQPGFDYPQPRSIKLNDSTQLYRSLLLMASGIQMAGPRLTPKTFEAALHRTVFPNPASTIKPGRVGFPGSGHSMLLDAAEAYWSEVFPSSLADEGAGTWCYTNVGGRYMIDTWPAGEAGLFEPSCFNGAA